MSEADYILGVQLVWAMPPGATCGQAREIFRTLREARAAGCVVEFERVRA